VARWQDRLDPLWWLVTGGCHLNRKIDDLVSGNGFRMDALANARIPGHEPTLSSTKAKHGQLDRHVPEKAR
jgi:hypothetical protein